MRRTRLWLYGLVLCLILGTVLWSALALAAPSQQDHSEPLGLDLDTSVPTSFPVNPDTTTATDADGNSLVLVEGGEVVIGEGSITLNVPVRALKGVRVASFVDTSTGVNILDRNVELPVKDPDTGETVLTLKGTLEDNLTGTETGTAAAAVFQSLNLVTQEIRKDLSGVDPNVGTLGFVLDAGLVRLPEGVRLGVTVNKELSDQDRVALELLARSQGKIVADVAGAVTVATTNLDGQADVRQAEITMSASLQWLFAFGTRNLRIAHIDASGNVEILGTECSLTCVARTQAGLSEFALLALLDRPFGFSVQSPTIAPEVAAPGEAVNITVGVFNGGFGPGAASLILSIKEPGPTSFDPIAVGEVTLAGGEQGTVSFLFTPEVEGRYEVDVEGVKGAFDVVSGTEPALLRFTNLTITPELVAPGELVTLSMFVENLGDEDSTVEIEFRINDVLFELRSVVVPGRISVEVIFEFTPPVEGTYLVEFVDPDELIAPLIGEIIARTPSAPAEFVLSQLVITPLEVGPGGR